jgi:hypothetical protein
VTLDFEMQKAARDLPLGWEIAVVCEKGAGWVELHNDEGDHVEFDTSPDRNLAEQVCDAVAYAIEVTSLETVPAPAACSITEYDGAYRCTTHSRTWGAVTNPDQPCEGWSANACMAKVRQHFDERRCTCKDFPGADEFCTAHSTSNR